MTNVTMQAKTITAKLRDAVPVRFMESGEEKARYRNIDIPDSLKELEITDFAFDTVTDGKITFQLFFDEGVLPQEFPAIREKFTRAEKAAMKATAAEETEAPTETETTEETAATIETEESTEVIVNIAAPIDADNPPSKFGDMVLHYNVAGDQRKALVTAIAEITGAEAEYKKAPTYAYEIGNYRVDRNGTLTGEHNQDLIDALAERGFIAA